MKSDRKARTQLARVDDDEHKRLISSARNAIYQQNFDVDSAAVERLLKPQSLVPTKVKNLLFQIAIQLILSVYTECLFCSAILIGLELFSVICC
jgi:hypothetical protein